jgi:hypothetical protein
MENRAWKIEGQFSGAGSAEMTEFARMFGFTRPEATMRDIVARPVCVVPLAVASLVAMIYFVVVQPHLTWHGNDELLAMAGVAANLVVRVLLMAAMLTAFAAVVTRASVSFAQVFAVASYARMPGVAATVLAILLILLRRASGLPDGHPVNPMLTSLAVFLNPTTASRFIYSLASSVDCFVFWQLSLMAVGLRQASRLSSTAATVGVAIYWVISTFAMAAWVEWGTRLLRLL